LVEAEPFREVPDNRANIARETRMIERRREVIGISAIAHVHTNHVASCIPCAGSQTANVLRVGRSFETVDQDNREPLRPSVFGLPGGMAEHAAAICRIDFNDLSLRHELEGGPWKVIADERLKVAIPEATSRDKRM